MAHPLDSDFDALIGRARCRLHAERYKPREDNRSRTYYYLSEEHLPPDLLCGACMQVGGNQVRAGLIVSQAAKDSRVVVFQAFAAYRLTEDHVSSLRQIWPRS